uniref:Uncharacterized protein n=1 Tax=viral metagenome TaxID=1070528 RepID=A0A6H1Z8V1_9ZZZZ
MKIKTKIYAFILFLILCESFYFMRDINIFEVWWGMPYILSIIFLLGIILWNLIDTISYND